jgi:hypothetical protein
MHDGTSPPRPWMSCGAPTQLARRQRRRRALYPYAEGKPGSGFRHFETIEELRLALLDFAAWYNTHWLMATGHLLR